MVALTFDKRLATLGAEQFLSILARYLRMRGLIDGPDFALGRRREGNTVGTDQDRTEDGLPCHGKPSVQDQREVVSSTAVRKALAEGDMAKVARLTGVPTGQRQALSRRGAGKTIGFPTANLSVPEAGGPSPMMEYTPLSHTSTGRPTGP